MLNRRDVVVVSGMGGSECGEDRTGDARRDQSRRLQTRNHQGRLLHRSGQVRLSGSGSGSILRVCDDERRVTVCLQEHHPRQRLRGQRQYRDQPVVQAGGAGVLQELRTGLDLRVKLTSISASLAGPVICRGLEFVLSFSEALV